MQTRGGRRNKKVKSQEQETENIINANIQEISDHSEEFQHFTSKAVKATNNRQFHSQMVMKIYREIVEMLKNKKREQFLVVGPDPSVIEEILTLVFKKIEYEVNYVDNKKDSKPNGKLFVLDCNLKECLAYQSLLYYYLELPLKHDTIICLTATSIQCLNTFEKRVKSRFKNKIFVCGYDMERCTKVAHDNEVTEILYASYFKHKSMLEERELFDMHVKYQLQFYSIDFICDILEPCHFQVLILIANYNKKTKVAIYELFQKYAVKELKAMEQQNVINAYYDLIELSWISTSGDLLIDKNEFMHYIDENCPLYLREAAQRKIK